MAAARATVRLELPWSMGLRGGKLYGPGSVDVPAEDAFKLGLIDAETFEKASEPRRFVSADPSRRARSTTKKRPKKTPASKE